MIEQAPHTAIAIPTDFPGFGSSEVFEVSNGPSPETIWTMQIPGDYAYRA
jgi:hypothetical protein